MAMEVDQGVEVAAKVNKAKPKQLKGELDKASKPGATKRNHPPYLQMVSEAISSLKERSGSSQPAIAKYLEDKYQSDLPPNFKRMLSIQLRNMSNSGKLSKVKNSFKLSSGRSKPAAAKPKSEGSKAAAAAAKPKKVKKTASKATIAASNTKAKASSTEARDLRAASRSKAKQAGFLPSTLTTKKRKPAISALNSPKRAKRLTK